MSYQATILARAPVAYWPLDDIGTSPPFADATGHGYDALPGDSTGTFSAGTPPFGCAGPSVRFAVADTSQWAFLYMAGTLSGWPSSRLPCGSAPFSYEYWVRLLGTDTNPLQLKTFVNTSGDRSLLEGPHVGTLAIHGRTDVGGFFTSQAAATDPFDVMAWTYVVAVWTGAIWQLYANGAPLSLTLDTPLSGSSFTPDGLSLGANFQVDFEAAHAAVYDRALSAGEVADGYAAAGCEWVRLIHVSGRGDWRTDGERLEEHAADKLARTHDGTTSTVFSDAVPVLQTPLAVLTTSPPSLVGKDPSTNLPAYCPPPPVVAIAPTPPTGPPTTVDPNEFRCNIAHYVAGEMELAYGYAVAKINTMNSAQWTLIGLGGPLAGVILALLNVAFPPLMIVTGFGVGLMALLGNDAQTSALLPLGGPAVEAMAHALYCALVPDSAGLYQITGTTLFNWSYNLTTFGADFTGNQLAEVRLLITVYQLAYWQQLGIQAGASGSTLCTGYSCSGLLP